MPDKTPEGTETTLQNEEDYHVSNNSSVTEPASPRSARTDLHRTSQHFHYCRNKNMEQSDSDRPISFGSTSSSASSRDSRCSFGSRMTLASRSHLGLFHQDKEAEAIKLELVPSQQLSNDDIHSNSSKEQTHRSPKERQYMLWKDTKGSVKDCSKSEEVAPTSPKLTYVDRVVQEIMQTERTYVQDLKSIVEDYLDCISDQTRLRLGTEDRSALFGNIRDIYHFNRNLLQDLENCDNNPVAIARCFVSKSEEFHIYTQYCTNYPRSVAVLTECMRNKSLANFFRERQEVLQHCLPLGSYLLKPVQRILKYHLLLHEISNHLDKETEGYDDVLDAINTMQRVAWHINDMKRKHEHDIRLQEIQSLLTNWKGPDLTSYGELVLEGTFRIQRAKNERTLFLFDKLLLITKKRDDNYTYKDHILCCFLMLVEMIPKEPLSFSVFHYKNPKLQHTVQAKSQQEKRLWILHLKRLILENHPAKIPAKAKQAILEMDAIHHPGFSYGENRETKATTNLKDFHSSRVRRKSEPSSNLHRAMKQNDLSPEVQKCISKQGSVMCPTSKLGSRELLMSPALKKQTNVNDDQEFFQQAYKNDKLCLRPIEQTDADDEEETEQHRYYQKGKGGRKRLNSQVSENVEKRRSTLLESQNSKDTSDEESSQPSMNHRYPPSALPTNIQLGISQTNSLIMNIIGGASALQNIWTDHQIRQVLFPPRRTPQEDEEDDDDYQMFMINECSKLECRRSQDESGPSSRPCSWHLGPMQEDQDSNSYCKIVRRASSVGENKSGSHSRCKQNVRHRCDMVKHCDIGPKCTTFESTEELTIDDIEHVYDNVSYDDLKRMGLTRREDSRFLLANDYTETKPFKGHRKIKSPSEPKQEQTLFRHETPSSSSQELRIEDENIYDSIYTPEQSLKQIHKSPLSRINNILGSDGEFQYYEPMGNFVSDDALQFSEDDSSDHRVPVADDYIQQFKTSSNSHSVAHKSAADKLSEEVDEIWNDLENYIKKNEEKKKERLLASFPVSKEDVHEKRHTPHRSPFNKEYSRSSICLQDNSPLPRMLERRDPSICKEDLTVGTSPSNTIPGLKRASLTGEVTFVDSPYFSSHSTLSCSDTMNAVQELDSAEKSKKKVFEMAREYSQKIRKANQFLKMKSPEQEHPIFKSQKWKSKDFATIMEEKKQGGTAIGARIAEYSQLYDQIIFRESPARPRKVENHCTKDLPEVRSEFYQQSSPNLFQYSSKCSQTGNMHTIQTNGEAKDFFAWSDLKTKSEQSVSGHTGHQRNLAAACSVPSLNQSAPSSLFTQRWSTPSQKSEEPTKPDHEYYSLGRRAASENARPYIRSQSSSSVLLHRTKEPIIHTKNATIPQSRLDLKAEKMSEIYHFERSSDGKGPQKEICDLTSQDSQKVLEMNTLSSLNAQLATLNYFANFKDTEGGEDDNDDDYVEIRSDDEEAGLESSSNQPIKLSMSDQSPKRPCSTSTPYSFSMPGTPVKTENVGLESHIMGYENIEQLNDYLWRPPSSNQQNIVQSLREKFQCLSSSSFT
ncbi:pleckstrin homology domain-containing family G member 1 [Gastrophryne carolinensis]